MLSKVLQTKRLLPMLTLVIIVTFLTSVRVASAHFNWILPPRWLIEEAEAQEITIFWGHPYEHILFDAPSIEAHVLKPDGSVTKLTLSEATVEGCRAWKTTFTPDVRGDYIIYVDAEPVTVEEEEAVWEDHVKAIVHYKVSAGWDVETGQKIEIVPLTRPYGMEESFIFVGKVLYEGNPLPGAAVEIEKYYSKEEAEAIMAEEPPEPLITRETTTDDNGVFSYTLDEPGVWVMCAAHEVGETPEGYVKEERAIIVVPIEEAFPKEVVEAEVPAWVEERISSLEEEVAEIGPGASPTLAYSALGIAVVAVVIAIVAVWRKK